VCGFAVLILFDSFSFWTTATMAAVMPVQSLGQQHVVYAAAPSHSEQHQVVYSVAPTHSTVGPVHYATYSQPYAYHAAPVTYVSHAASHVLVQQADSVEAKPVEAADNAAQEETEQRVEHPAGVDGTQQDGEEKKHEEDGALAEAPAEAQPAVQAVAPVMSPMVYSGVPVVYTASPTLLTSHGTIPTKIGQTVDGGVNPQWSARYVYNGVEYTTFDAYHAGVKSHVEKSAEVGVPTEEVGVPTEEVGAPVVEAGAAMEAEKHVRAVKPVKKGCC